jgi:hypothetical protein
MRALANLIIAGTALALMSAPASAAMGRAAAHVETADATAQQGCLAGGAACATEPLAQYCIADDKCATALPASTLISYDARMDAAAAAR